MQIHELPTISGSPSGGYFATDNGTQTTKIDYTALAQAIIEQYNASTLAGSAQSVKAALDGIKTDLNVVYGANPIKTLAATDDLLTLDVGMYRVANVLPLNAPSTTYKYGYATKQHRGASGYTYYEFIVGNGNGNDFKRYYGWQYSNSAVSIDWIEMAPQSAVDALNSNLASITFTRGIATTSGLTATIPNNYRGVLVFLDGPKSRCGVYLIRAYGNGSVNATVIFEPTDVTVLSSTNSLTITPTDGSAVCIFQNILGTVTV